MMKRYKDNSCFDKGKRITEEEYEEKKRFLKEVSRYAKLMYAFEISISSVPEKYREKVEETVRIMNEPVEEEIE